jgi:hypothetical protein
MQNDYNVMTKFFVDKLYTPEERKVLFKGRSVEEYLAEKNPSWEKQFYTID